MTFISVFWPNVVTRICRRSFVHHNVSGLNISRIVWPRITKFYTDIHTDLLYSHTGHDVTSYFWSAFIEVQKNGQKCRLRQLWVEFLQNRLTNLPDVSWLAVSFPGGCKMQLNTAQKCIKWVRPIKSWIILPLFNLEAPNFTQTSRPT